MQTTQLIDHPAIVNDFPALPSNKPILNLMDNNPPEFIPQEIEQQPLIEAPIDLSLIEDIYTVGLSPMARWRAYIDCENWQPKNFHDQLLKSRAYHARCVWEACFLMSFTNKDWLTIGANQTIKDVAHFELRKVEIQIMSYQLTCGMLGICCDKHPQLFFCAEKTFECVMFLAEHILKDGQKKMSNRKAFGEIQRTKPFKSESRKALGKYIDEGIYTVMELLNKGTVVIQENSTKFVEEMGNKLRLMICSFDKVAKIM